MESELNKAFCGVYNSSKEIIKNNQRHLFCNMLDLLSRTTKTTGEHNLKIDEFIHFWVTDILPLVFDNDKHIQGSAIAAVECVAKLLDFKILHASTKWNEIKAKIVQNYSKEIYIYREDSNPCWYKIWCILIRILDKEILKGASTINTFLSIVELGFRSPDYNVRAEAFYCWKVLIEIFAKNGEIYSQKRIRLICIPLKSSHSKTTQSAAVKFKVWWYFITKLNGHLEQYVDAILEPFWAFCYGSVNKNSLCITDFKEMTILCLICMLGSSNKLVKRRMEYFEIETISEPLINKNIMSNTWSSIITYAIEAIKDCNSVASGGIELLELLLRNLFTNIVSIGNMDALNKLFDKLSSCDDVAIMHVQTFLENYNFSTCLTSFNDTDLIGKFFSAFAKFIISNKPCSLKAVDEIVRSIFVLDSNRFKNVLVVFLNEILLYQNLPIEAGISTWKLITKSLISIVSIDHKSKCEIDGNIMNEWIIWPLKINSKAQCRLFSDYDEEFGRLLHMAQLHLTDGMDKSVFLAQTSLILQELYKFEKVNSYANAYFSCYVKTLTTEPHKELDNDLVQRTFNIINAYLSKKVGKEDTELCINGLKTLVKLLGECGIDKYFEDIKNVWSLVVNNKRNGSIEKSLFALHQKQFLEEVKRASSKLQYHQIRNYVENEDAFVIIPAVWSLNPDKLTERQKEKFFQKSDIPALYNDMSQSQEGFIKPWTPKKLVIARGHVNDIVIGNRAKAHFSSPDAQECSQSNNICEPPESKQAFINALTEAKLVDKSSDLDITASRQNINPSNKKQDDPIITCQTTKCKSLYVGEEYIPGNNHLAESVTHLDAIILKDSSSPPDRNLTNNSTSPVLKPKTTHLTGRGAQLINMIRNKKHDNYNTKQLDPSNSVTKMELHREKNDTCLNLSSTEAECKPSPTSLLVFSKTLPSPCASPSASILKRKHRNDSVDEVYDSQAFKRKRVSFHDPPVSVTKEYIKDEENKNNSKRCLLLDQELKVSTKYLLRRSGKIENHTKNELLSEISDSCGTTVKQVKSNLIEGESNGFKGDEELPLFRTGDDVLNFVVRQFPMDKICETYLTGGKLDKVESNFSKIISHYTNVNSSFKSKLLETLSEQHPKDFLEVAIQENLSSVVCDRLSANAIIDYVCSKAQISTACRTRLLQETQNILNHEKFEFEKFEFIRNVLTFKCMRDEQLLNLIELLFESKRKHQRAVSESAIDSSSTL